MNRILTILFLIGFSLVYGQRFTVTGYVTGKDDGIPLRDAIVTVGGQSVKTNVEGFFILSVNKGEYLIQITKENYKPYKQSISLDKNLSLAISLVKQSDYTSIESVILNSYKKNESGSKATVDRGNIDNNTTKDLGELLSQISGVSSLKTGNSISKPVIHGLYGNRVPIVADGIKMEEQEWGIEHAPNIDINEYEKINIVEGASALRYGNQGSGGVIELEKRTVIKKDTLIGKVLLSYISNGRGGGVSSSFSKYFRNQWYFGFSGSSRILGDQYIPQHTLQNTGSKIYAFDFNFGKLGSKTGIEFGFSKIHQNFGIFRGSHIGNAKDFYEIITSGISSSYYDRFSYKINNPRQNVDHQIAKISFYRKFRNFGKFSALYSYQLNNRKEFDIRRGEYNNIPSLDLRLATHSLRLGHVLKKGFFTFENGMSANYQDNFANPETRTKRLIPSYKKYGLGIFSVLKYRGGNFSVEGGIRYDRDRYDAFVYYDEMDWEKYRKRYSRFFIGQENSRILTHPLLNYNNLSGIVGFSYHFNKDWTFKSNFSGISRTPNVAELFADGLHHSAAIIEHGNLGIKSEMLYKMDISLQMNFNVLEGMKIDLNPYMMYSEGFINQVPTGTLPTVRGVFPVWEYQQIKAKIVGLDVDTETKISSFLLWKGQLSILRGEDQTNREPLILMMPSRLRNLFDFSFSNLPFRFSLENEVVFKQNRYPLRNVKVDMIEDKKFITREVDYSSTPSAYQVFNIRAETFLFKKIGIHLSVNNILNKEYRNYMNRLRFFFPEPGRNYVITLKYQF
ncbi:MAG: TonB-dependent receptor [Bergeyella sp.]|nr:TonB-dependent receptor [Bergeyella sp.]